MKHSLHILSLALMLQSSVLAYGQTPFDAFSPETSRPILDRDSIAAWRAEQKADTILCAIVADLCHEQLLLVDLTNESVLAYAPFTEEMKNWMSVDPLADKYLNVTPYLYCNGNSVMLVDPDGRAVKPNGNDELQVILNTLPDEAQQFVRINSDGFIDKSLINNYKGADYNMRCLQKLVNSTRVVSVLLDDKFQFVGKEGQIGEVHMGYTPADPELVSQFSWMSFGNFSTGEGTLLGQTLFPDHEGFLNSTDDEIKVIINKNLSPMGAAEVYSHEANGHALVYVLSGNNAAAHKFASHWCVNWKDRNWLLNLRIKRSVGETTLLMKNRN